MKPADRGEKNLFKFRGLIQAGNGFITFISDSIQSTFSSVAICRTFSSSSLEEPRNLIDKF
jgi:hypothetical protein